MLFCSTNKLRQSAVDSLEESRSPATTIKVPNFFQFKSEQISIFTCVSCTHNNLWYTSYRHNYLDILVYRHNYASYMHYLHMYTLMCYITISLNSGLNSSVIVHLYFYLLSYRHKLHCLCSCSALNNDTKQLDKK